MMEYLTRPGFNGGGAVSNRNVLPKRKPAAEVKKRKKINYEKIKQYLGKESQKFIERELGFAVGGRVNPAQLKQRFMQLVASIQEAEPEEIPGIVAQAKQIRDQIDEINQTLAPERQIKITSQGLDFDNPFLDAIKIEEAVMPTPEVTGGLTKDIVPESLTTGNPALKGIVPDFPKGTKGTLADSEEKEDPKLDRRVAIDPKRNVVQASMKMGRRTDKSYGDYLKRRELFKSIDPTITETEGSFAEGGSVETPKRGLVDEPGSYAGLSKKEIKELNKIKGIKSDGNSIRVSLIKGKKRIFSKSFETKNITYDEVLKVYNDAVEDNFPNRLSDQELIRLRQSDKYKNLSNPKFADALNDLDYETYQGAKWNRNSVENVLKKYDLTFDTKPPRSRKETIKIIKEAGKIHILDQVKNLPENEALKILRKEATIIVNTNKVLEERGRFPIARRLENRVWHNFFQAAKRTNFTEGRIKMSGTFNGKSLSNPNNFPKKDGKVNWHVKDKKGVPAWKKVVFTDTKAPKGKNVFKWDPKDPGGNISKQLDNAFGKGFYKKTIQAYVDGAKDGDYVFTKGKNAGKNLKTVLRDNALLVDYKDQINQGRKLPDFKTYKQNKLKSMYTITEAHHPFGVENDPYTTEPATRYANRRQNTLLQSYKAGNITLEKFQAESRKLGGIKTILDDGRIIGESSTPSSRIQSMVAKTKTRMTPELKNYINSLVKNLPKNSQINLCRKLNVKSVGDLVKGCPTMIAEKPNQTLNLIEGEAKKLPKQDGDRLLKAAANIRQGLKLTGIGVLTEVPAEFLAGVNPFKRGKPMDEIIDESILGLYGIGRDLNRPNVEEFVNTTKRAGALKFYDYYKDQARLSEIDTTLRRLSADQPDADTSDLLQEKELIEGRLGTEPTEQDAIDFEIFFRRRAGELEANKKARGQYGPFTNIIQGTTPQSFSDAAEELNIDLGGMLGDIVLPERQDIVPRTTRAQRRDRDFMRQRAEGIKRLEQNILFPATDSSFAGGGIAKQAGVESGPPPESGPNSQGLAFLMKRGR